jgi:hypothetical protein
VFVFRLPRLAPAPPGPDSEAGRLPVLAPLGAQRVADLA